MRWAWTVARIGGIAIHVHATFPLLLLWVALGSLREGATLAAAAGVVVLILAVFVCVVLHELGHAFVARRFGIGTRDITLYPFGGVARLDRIPEKPAQELVIAVAGPLVNIALASLLGTALVLLGHDIGAGALAAGPSMPLQLLWINVGMAVFNLIPAFPMDGGRVLRALLAFRLEYARATRIAARVGQGLALGLAVLGLVGGPMFFIIALFVWIAAGQEAGAAEAKALLRGLSVRQAMMTDVRTIDGGATLGDAASALLASSQTVFPVMNGGRIDGVLTSARLAQRLAAEGAEGPVATAVERGVVIADPAESLDVALERLERAECPVLIVMRGDTLVGLITPEHLGELLFLERALMRRAPAQHLKPAVA